MDMTYVFVADHTTGSPVVVMASSNLLYTILSKFRHQARYSARNTHSRTIAKQSEKCLLTCPQALVSLGEAINLLRFHCWSIGAQDK